MSEDTHVTGHHRRSTDMPEGLCPLHETLTQNLGDIKAGVERIEKGMNDGNVKFATMELRLNNLERIVYGAVAVSLLSLAGAILGLVFRRGVQP